MLLTVGCKIKERIIYQTYTETVRYTIISVAPDSSSIKLLLECDSLNNVIIRDLLEYKGGHKLKPPDISISDNILTSVCRTDTIIYTFPIPVIEIREKKIEVVDNTRHRFGEDLFYWAGVVFLAALVSVTAIRIMR